MTPNITLADRIPGNQLPKGLPFRTTVVSLPIVVAILASGSELAAFWRRHRRDEKHVLLWVKGKSSPVVRTRVAG